jgi:predicted RNA binding protein YcfA (HicA-like mRNA interferase family)
LQDFAKARLCDRKTERQSHHPAQELRDRGITVPVPNHSELAKGTLKSIIDQSEIPRSEFLK